MPIAIAILNPAVSPVLNQFGAIVLGEFAAPLHCVGLTLKVTTGSRPTLALHVPATAGLRDNMVVSLFGQISLQDPRYHVQCTRFVL